MTDRDWRYSAECLGEDSELFFPVGNGKPAQLQTEEAKYVCGRCEVRQECLAHAQKNHIEYGVWGGLSEDERRGLGRRATAQLKGKTKD